MSLLLQFNLDYMEMHKLFLNTLLNSTFPKCMGKTTSKHFYPVIVGGQNVMRCAKQTEASRRLIEEILSSDIDLEYVVMQPLTNLDDPILEQVHAARMKLIDEVLKDRDLTSTIRGLERDNAEVGLMINLRADDSMLALPESHEAYPARVVRIRADYYVGYELQHSIVLVDTGIYSNLSRRKAYYLYQRFFDDADSKPVPTVTVNGVTYGTCSHAFYDTVRMLDFYAKEMNQATSGKRMRTLFVKYANYIAKFVALYSLLNNIKDDKHYKDIYKIYTTVKGILVQIDAYNMYAFATISDEQKHLLSSLINVLKKKTTLSSLLELLYSARTPMRSTSTSNTNTTSNTKSKSNNKTKGGGRFDFKSIHNQLHEALLHF